MAMTKHPSQETHAPPKARHQDGAERPPSAPILIISHDVIGQRMAGPGIRYWEAARVLATHHPVTLIAPQPIDVSSTAFTCGAYTWGDQSSLAPWLCQAQIVVANGFVLLGHPELAHITQPLVLDLYDPVVLENLELFRTATEAQRREQYERDRALLHAQLSAGDFFLCATERQRDLYIGALMLHGRITPTHLDHDRQLRALIDVASFGLPNQPPVQHRAALRGTHPGIAHDASIILWTGGLWDWMDPLTLIDAMPHITARHPHARLVFLAGQHPGSIAPMRMPATARARAAERGLLDHTIFFYDQWVAYDQRIDILLDADIAVSLHYHHLETHYAAIRSRFLDHLWAGLPSVVSDGDAAAHLVRTHHLGSVVAAQDTHGVAHAINALLDDAPQRATCAANARNLAQHYTWERTLAPLIHYCQHPTSTRQHSSPAPPNTHTSREDTPMQNQDQPPIEQLEQHWQFGTALRRDTLLHRIAERLITRLLGPVFDQQRTFNAATVKLMYHINPQIQQLHSQMNALMAQIVALQNTQTALHTSIHTLGAYDGDLNDRLTRLTTTVQLLDNAICEADLAQADLAAQLASLPALAHARGADEHA